MAEQQSGLWADVEAALRPGPEEFFRRLVVVLENERDPEALALTWLRRLLVLLSSDETALVAALRAAAELLEERCQHLTGMIASARHELALMGEARPEAMEVPAIEPESESRWHEWLARSPADQERLPLSKIARDEDGYPLGKIDRLSSDAEQEATEGAISSINRVLAVVPAHVEELKPLLIRARRELSERNDRLGALFGFL